MPIVGSDQTRHAQYPTLNLGDRAFRCRQIRLQVAGEAVVAVGMGEPSRDAVGIVLVWVPDALGWKPIFFMNSISAFVPVVLQPAGLESSVGLLSSTHAKDPADPAFEDDAAVKDWRAWMRKYLPDADLRRLSFVNGYNSAAVIVQVLKQAGNDLSRENIMRQATNLRDLELPMLLPRIKVNTSPTDYYAVQQLQLVRFDGKRWVRFGDLVYAQ